MKRLSILLATTVACAVALAQTPGGKPAPGKPAADKPLTQDDLLKQIEAFNPITPAPATPAPSAASILAGGSTNLATADPNSPALASITPGTAGGTMIGTHTATAPASPEDKPKGPTIIDAMEATFDQRANVAVFVGDVIVKDPEFNVWCDKLTAFLNQDDKAPAAKGSKVTPKKVTPKPVTPRPDGTMPPPARGGGLDHAIAVCSVGRRVKITQDKVDPDTGKIKHGIGFSDWATYDAKTGDVVMYGSPDVTQDLDRCIATAPYTVMTLNRDGHMIAKGPHRTFIVDDTTPKNDAEGRPLATPRPTGATPSGSPPPNPADTGARSPQ